MEPQSDEVGAFVPGPRAVLAPTGGGPLDGLRLGVKDLFDIAHVATTCGSPDWAATHPLPMATAPTVAALLRAGARLVGKTKTVELAYGLTGENPWHGTPINPAAPDRFPGGSSCGSAAAVAADLVDIGLGSDTGGSVRIPASYCGLYGIRPTQGAISLAGCAPLAPSLDTPGWFTRDAALLERVGDVLLPGEGGGSLGGPLLRAEEAWASAEPAVAAALSAMLARLTPLFGAALSVSVAPEGWPALYTAFRAVQGQEAWAAIGPWYVAHSPRLSPTVARRLHTARDIPEAEIVAGRALRQTVQRRLRGLLGGGAVLVFPTSPCAAPRLDASDAELEAVREATVAVNALAGFAGLPQVSLPAGGVEVPGGTAPIGLSLVAAPGRDRALLALARAAADLMAS